MTPDVKNMNTWLLFLPLFPVQVQTLIVVIIGMLVLLLDFLGLVHLGQLLIFHIYLRSASPRSEIMDKKGKSQEEIKSMRTQQAQQEAELTPRPAGVVPEAKKMTTFEYLINNRKEESSKHQAVRKDPYVQMDKGVLQQGAGALGSSAQGVKAKSSLLIHKHLCHFCTSVNQDGDSTAREGDEDPCPSALGAKARNSRLICRRLCQFSTRVHPDGGSMAQEADDAPSISTLGLQQETTEPMKTDSAESED
ncbi:palmitoyltransferase ZDHHC11 isoform X20 [Homo sapiens]|uniref:palmitoyltransferase ZDHHC11 isoform X20 n=1 Tax=Homo sapiens TaxID=9606 RepID=UPI001FB0A60D|nr:palmitoyltransferase ZDHHC11 isoform X20 [Homo sapiens]XP_054209491.1 palmitoyltransferase ZDHHC11 isoform X20 [Homo sapiens]